MNKRYPWDRLKKPGDWFIWRVRSDEASLRSQANKQGRKRSIMISVKVEKASKMRVTYEYGIL